MKMDINTAIDQEIIITYYPSPSLLFIVEANHTRLVDQKRGCTWAIQGVEAVIWNLLTSGYDYQKIVYFVSLLSNLPGVSAAGIVLATLQSWADQGILEKRLNDQLDS